MSILTPLFAGILLLIGQTAPAPTPTPLPRNPKLAAPDLEAAQAEAAASGGVNAELLYAARLDAVQKGSFDSLIVIYARPVKGGKDYYAVILREGGKLPLAIDKQGRALKAGDKFLRMGLKHEEGKSPILRLIASGVEPGKGEQQRNLDFRFNGTAFALETQSVVPLAK